MTFLRQWNKFRGSRILALGSSYQKTVLGMMNLVAYYPLNETSGTTAGEVLNGYNGTYNGCTLNNLAGPGASMGSAPLFVPASSSQIQLPAASLNGVFNTNAGTLALWLDLNQVWSTASESDVAYVGASIGNRVIFFKGAANNFILRFSAGGTNNQFSYTFSTAGWHHFALTWDRTANQLIGYIDGVKTGSTITISGTWTGSLANGQCLLGGSATVYWPGWLQGVALFSAAKAQSDITTLATAT